MSHRESPLCSLLCGGLREHWHPIVGGLLSCTCILQRTVPGHLGSGANCLSCYRLQRTSCLENSTHFFFIIYLMNFISENVSFPQVPLKKNVMWIIFLQRLWLILFCYDSRNIESTMTCLFLGIIDSGFCNSCVVFPPFSSKQLVDAFSHDNAPSHTGLRKPFLLTFIFLWLPVFSTLKKKNHM